MGSGRATAAVPAMRPTALRPAAMNINGYGQLVSHSALPQLLVGGWRSRTFVAGYIRTQDAASGPVARLRYGAIPLDGRTDGGVRRKGWRRMKSIATDSPQELRHVGKQLKHVKRLAKKLKKAVAQLEAAVICF